MRLCSFRYDGRSSYGAVIDGQIVDLGKRLSDRHPDLRALLDGADLDDVKRLVQDARPDIGLDQVELLPVVPNPDKIICVGLNYEEHRAEAKRDKTDHPALFLRLAASQVGHRQPLVRPRESEKFDYEGEIAVIIGKPGRRIPEAQAATHIAGFACYNDGSVRDWQRHTTQWTAGKNFAGTGAFGPWLVTCDEIASAWPLTLVTRLNGQEMQRATTAQLIHSIPRLIAYISTFIELLPGDVIVSGTPGGVGYARTPPVFLKPGDIIEVEVSGIGILSNSIAAEA